MILTQYRFCVVDSFSPLRRAFFYRKPKTTFIQAVQFRLQGTVRAFESWSGFPPGSPLAQATMYPANSL
jgi:hypothetical protein